MDPRHFTTTLILIFLTGVVSYQTSFLKNRKIFQLSLQQILYLVFLPGVIFILTSSYIQSLLVLPRARAQFIHDGILTDSIYLSMFFAYGGVAIHGITKMLSHAGLRHEDSEPAKINRYFHTTFSHNLVYGSMILFAVSLALLEINHILSYSPPNLTWLVVRGVGIAFSVLFAMFAYTRSEDQYTGRWADLKAMFVIAWCSLILLYVAVKKTSADLDSYQLLLPIFITLAVVVFANIVLVIRRIKRHKLYSPHRFIAFHRQKRHPTVQEPEDDFEGGFEDEVE